MSEKIDVIELSKNLTLSDIEHLIWIFKPHFDVYVGRQNRHMISSEIESICFNGASLQINLELSDLENLSDNEFINSAFYGVKEND